MHITTFAIFLILSSLLVSAQKYTPIDSAYESTFDDISDTIPVVPIFSSEEPLDFVLEYDITSFIRQKRKSEYIDAKLIISNKQFTKEKDIRLKARGNFRKGQCFFPPIALNFKTDPIEHTTLEGIKKIKLVTHCNSSNAYSNYILKEFLIYKLYNELTDYSFRVKLLNITYIDTGKKKRHYQKYGFMIEPLDVLTKRTESVEIDPKIIRGKDVIAENADVVALFHYMIGNLDWRFSGGHNTKYVKSLNEFSTQVIPIPYDFDFSGFVDTPYSFPQEWANVESTKDREYLGYCRADSNYFKAIDLFQEKKESLFSIIDDFEYLSKKERQYLRVYLESFYLELNRPKNYISKISYQCRGLDF